MKKLAVAGTVLTSLALSGCGYAWHDHCWHHHCEPVMVKGFASTAEAPVMQTKPAADWK